MTLSERLDRLEPRERRLLRILASVFGIGLVLLVPAAFFTTLSARRAENQAMREAIQAVEDGREQVLKRERTRQAILQRYARPAPALAGFLETAAKANSLEIPESQDRAVVPHTKQYDERSTKIVLRQVGMFNLVKFMEQLENSGSPVEVSLLNIRKRGADGDVYDVEMIVSAYDRKAEEKPKVSKPKEEGEKDPETSPSAAEGEGS
jgi:general secretion pathway protein M